VVRRFGRDGTGNSQGGRRSDLANANGGGARPRGIIRTRHARQVGIQGASGTEIADVEEGFDFEALTLGLARRFATYKRPNLLLHDRARLIAIL